MANQLSVTKSSSIKQLHDQGWSQRRIAEAVGVDRKTVRRHLQHVQAGDQSPSDSKGTIAPTGSDRVTETDPNAKSGSQCEPFREVIEEMLRVGLSAQRVFQDLQEQHAFDGSYYRGCRRGHGIY